MNGSNDATCPKCKKRFGWFGRAIDRPPCPQCKHQISKEDLEHDEKEMARARAEAIAEMEEESKP